MAQGFTSRRSRYGFEDLELAVSLVLQVERSTSGESRYVLVLLGLRLRVLPLFRVGASSVNYSSGRIYDSFSDHQFYLDGQEK